MITVPDIIVKPFADSGDVQVPPQTSPSGFVNFTDGYTQFYEISLTANNPQAKAVERQVQNYMFNMLTKNVKSWQSAGLPVWFASMPGGYTRNTWVLRMGGDNIWRPYRAVVDGTSADPLNSTDWEYVQLSSEVIKNIPMPAGGTRGPTTALITAATDFDTLLNGTWQVASDTIAAACPHVPIYPNYETTAYAGMIEAISWSSGAGGQVVTVQRYTNRLGSVATRGGLGGAFGGWVYQTNFLMLQQGYGLLAATNGTISPTANVYVANTLPSFGYLTDGCEIRVTWGSGTPANTGPSTFNLNGIGPFNILSAATQPLQGGEIQPGGAATLRFRAGAGWLLLNVFAGNLPVMPATQDRHATPYAQVVAMINAAKITQVDWSQVSNKPNVAIQNMSAQFSSLEISSAVPYIDFHFGSDAADYDVRVANDVAGTLNIYNKQGGSLVTFANGATTLYKTTFVALPLHLSGGGTTNGGNGTGQLIFEDGLGGNVWYAINGDTNSLYFVVQNGSSQTVTATMTRTTGSWNFGNRPTWAGTTPWDSGNFTPSQYRTIANTSFATQIQAHAGVQFDPGAPIYWTDAANSTTWFYATHNTTAFSFNTSAGQAYTVDRATAKLNFNVRPNFAGNVPWDSANFTPSSYRTIANTSFTTQIQAHSGIQFDPGAPIYWTDAANSTAWFYANHSTSSFSFNTSAGQAYTVDRASAVVNFNVRPTFAGNVPWDSGNFVPSQYAVLAINNPQWMGLISSSTATMSSLNGEPGGLRIYTGGGQGTSACISFLRDGQYGVFLGLDTDNVMKIGGWSLGSAAYPIITTSNLSTYLPAALAAQPVNGIGSYALLVAKAMPSPNAPGGLVAGANLLYGATDGNTYLYTSPPGTWRMSGTIGDADGVSPNSTTVWQRIS